MEIQETLTSQNNLEKEKQSWKIHIPQVFLQSYTNEDSLALA